MSSLIIITSCYNETKTETISRVTALTVTEVISSAAASSSNSDTIISKAKHLVGDAFGGLVVKITTYCGDVQLYRTLVK